MTYDSDSLLPIFLGACVTALSLLITHLFTWRYRHAIPLVAKYVIGVAFIGVGFSLCSYLEGDFYSLIAFWTIAGSGGVVVSLAHLIRELLGDDPVLRLVQRAAEVRRGLRQ